MRVMAPLVSKGEASPEASLLTLTNQWVRSGCALDRSKKPFDWLDQVQSNGLLRSARKYCQELPGAPRERSGSVSRHRLRQLARTRGIPALRLDDRQVQSRLVVLGPPLQHAPQPRRSLVEAALLDRDHGETVNRIGVVRVELRRAAVIHLRLVIPP